jgi:WD40 repeat protein
MNCIRVATFAAVSALILSLAAEAVADEKSIPPDAASLDLDLPQGARVEINGQNFGEHRSITFRPLQPDRLYPYQLTTHLPSGGKDARTILVERGRPMHLAIADDRQQRPELVLQKDSLFTLGRLATFSPDGRLVATQGNGNSVIVWDARSGLKLRTCPAADIPLVGPMQARFEHNGDHLRTLDARFNSRLWDLTTGKLLESSAAPYQLESALTTGERLPFGTDFDQSSAVHRLEGDRAYATSKDGSTIILWAPSTGKPLKTIKGARVADSFRLDRGEGWMNGSNDRHSVGDPRQRILTTVSPNGSIERWEPTNGELINTLDAGVTANSWMAVSADGNFLVTGPEKGARLSLWDAARAQKLAELQWRDESNVKGWIGRHAGPSGVALSPDGQTLAATAGNIGNLIDVSTGKIRVRLGRSPTHVTEPSLARASLACSIFSSGPTSELAVFDYQQGKKVFSVRHDSNSEERIALSPDGRRIVSDRPFGITMWNVETGERLWNKEFRRDDRTSEAHLVCFYRRGERIARRYGNVVTLLDARTGEVIGELKPEKLQTSGILAPQGDDGACVVTRTDNRIVVKDLETGRSLCEFEMDPAWKDAWWMSTSFSKDGRLLAVRSDRNVQSKKDGPPQTSLDVYDLVRKEKVGAYLQNSDEGFLGEPQFSPDGRLILVPAHERFAILDAKTVKPLAVFPRGQISEAFFSDDGEKIVATQMADGIFGSDLLVLDLRTQSELYRIVSTDDGRDWLVVTPNGLFDGSVAAREQVTYRVGGGLTVVPVDRFFQDFYYPGLLAAIWKGEHPKPQADFAKAKPPTLRIVSPRGDENTASDEATVEVEAVDEGGGIKGPFLRHNGAKVLASVGSRREGNTLRQSFQLRLIEGDNHIRLEAASADGSWESEPAKLVIRCSKHLAKPELFLVAAGVSKYADPGLSLRYAGNDAQAICKLFRERGRTLYNDVHVTQLLDEQATKAGIRDALKTIARSAQPQDTVMVYLSGHGLTVGQRYYFIPHEIKQQQDRFEDDVRRQGYPQDLMADDLSSVPALKRILILDTCNSGSAISRSANKGKNPFAFRGAIARLNRANGIYTIAAASASEETVEIKELKHGVLTYALLAGLKAVDEGPLADKAIQPNTADKVVGILDWFSFASGEVPRLTKRYIGQEQEVQMRSEGSSFPVLPLESN